MIHVRLSDEYKIGMIVNDSKLDAYSDILNTDKEFDCAIYTGAMI